MPSDAFGPSPLPLEVNRRICFLNHPEESGDVAASRKIVGFKSSKVSNALNSMASDPEHAYIQYIHIHIYIYTTMCIYTYIYIHISVYVYTYT